MLKDWKHLVRQLKTETYAIHPAARDPRVPWHAKGLILFVVAYTFSSIALIPDFIYVLGYIDDLIIMALWIFLSLEMIPTEVMTECRVEAQKRIDRERQLVKSPGQ